MSLLDKSKRSRISPAAEKSSLFPPVVVTSEISCLVADICERVGALSAIESGSGRLRLRRDSQVRSVQASLQIEGNTLGLEQVTALLDGRRVLGPPKDIQEARNALAAYGKIADWDPGRLPDLCEAHAVLMQALVDHPGKFRSGSVGVKRGDDLVHVAPPADRVPALMEALFAEIKATKDHPLIASCRFHYEFEFIHPFPDGNGRLGRLWQTLLLARWRPLFANLPVETLVRDRQADYYVALGAADQAGQSAPFVCFMLTAIRDALIEVAKSDSVAKGSKKSNKKSDEKILAAIAKNPWISVRELADDLGLSVAGVAKNIVKLKALGKLSRIGPDKGGHWEVLP